MKFSIRDLLLVTVIVALAAGWWVDRLDKGRIAASEKHWRKMAVDFALRLASATDKPVEVVTPEGKRGILLGDRYSARLPASQPDP